MAMQPGEMPSAFYLISLAGYLRCESIPPCLRESCGLLLQNAHLHRVPECRGHTDHQAVVLQALVDCPSVHLVIRLCVTLSLHLPPRCGDRALPKKKNPQQIGFVWNSKLVLATMTRASFGSVVPRAVGGSVLGRSWWVGPLALIAHGSFG